MSVGTALAALYFAPLAGAAVLFSDSFDYPDGALVTVSGNVWSNHSGTIGQLQVISGRAFLSQTDSEDVSALLSGQPYPATTNVMLYARFRISFTSPPVGSGSYFAHFKGPTTTFRSKLYAITNDAAPGFFRVGLANVDSTGPNVVINADLAPGTNYVLVMRYAPSNGVSTLWLNPSVETDPGVTAADTVTTASINAFALRQSLSSGNGMGSLYVDDLRVATTFGEVVSNSLPAVPPGISAAPQNQTVSEGSTAIFSVAATGTEPLGYQWQFYATNLPGATNAMLTLTGVTTNQAGPYAVSIANLYGTTNSQPATLTVVPEVDLPVITTQPQSQVVAGGDDVVFTVSAGGTPPLGYQWQFNATNLAGATDATLALTAVTTNQAGPYVVIVTNAAGLTSSQPAILTVNASVSPPLPALSVLTYNVKGNGATDWSTNSTQVQAIGRQMMYLQPDIITFNEIPYSYTWQMTNFVAAYLPGYYMATNSGTDGFIRSVILSRYPIIFSQKWLDGVSLAAFGYSGNFSRDVFQAQVAVPGFAQPLDVFVTHLKATMSTPQADADKRAAEASAVSNFLVTTYLPGTNTLHPYLLSGDLNEDIFRPETNRYTTGQPIQRLVSTPTGLQLTTPLNSVTHTDLTVSFPKPLNSRFDYILPCGLLFSNIVSSQVFRTDLLTNPPPPLLSTDSTNSDHLPVLMVFANPYNHPFRLTSFERNSQTATLKWESVRGQAYRVEASSDLATWGVFANNLIATGTSFTLATNVPDALKFFRVYRVP